MGNRELLEKRIQELRSQSLSLDLTRGKPSPEQLDLSVGMLEVVDADSFKSNGGIDTRNYGGLDGLDEAKQLFGDYLGVQQDEVIIGGNSSLALMHDTLSQLTTHGTAENGKPWFGQKVRFLCPVPGYDRHFTLCRRFGIEMITVSMNEEGPDVGAIEKLVAEDPTIKGMWCTPRYSNPTGYTCSKEVVERLASIKTESEDFVILWDDAYAVHHIGEGPEPLESLLDACKRAGNPERVIMFGSTSKISFAGAGIAMTGGSVKTCDWLRQRLFAQTIGNDKINMLRHVLFFQNMDGILQHMKKQAEIVAPKFAAVEQGLSQELGGKQVATWTKPKGGYFVSLDTPDGCASEVISMAADLGVKLTPAGSTFPLKKDPKDNNIRIAPTFPSLADVQKAVEVLALSILYVAGK